METIFSIVRRRLLHRRVARATQPDRLHLHSLLYRRRVLPWVRQRAPWAETWVANAGASALLLLGSSLPMALVVVGQGSIAASAAALALGVGGYLLLYRRLVPRLGVPADAVARSGSVRSATPPPAFRPGERARVADTGQHDSGVAEVAQTAR